MEVYVLDSLLRRDEVVDRFESLIWTERFNDVGDFELVVESSRGTRGMFKMGAQLALNRSYRVMTVETTENTTDSDGRNMLKVKGRSIEALLEDRIARNTLSNTTTEPTWDLTGTPGDIARRIFDEVCRNGDLDLRDKIPFLQPGTIFTASSVPEPSTTTSIKLEPTTVFEAIKNICETYDLGFRLVRNFDSSQLYFDIYAGNDLTTRQTVRTPVVFSESFDNLQNTKEFATIEKAKNVAYVISPAGTAVVYPSDVDPEISGFERRVLLVNASDITAESSTNVAADLKERGIQELFKTRTFSAFDGELNTASTYRYGVDYELGDIVEMRNADGLISYKRVTEQIFVHDQEGERSYPTVTMNLFLAANTWLSQRSTKNWEDFGTTEYWSTM